ncbi:MAG: helix-turn-helix transcriptional regulator [Gemmatimonadaceae bacterium]|nr:helix-turn-helix transcriptional regulator [Gemmatimonadaceae bacterium]
MPRPVKRAASAASPTDFFLRFPGSTLVITLLADKWTIPVIHELSRGTRRTGELKDALGSVSQKMLTQTLRMLELSGLVERKVYPVVPPRVEYSLTPMGESINEPLAGLCEWVERHGATLAALHARRQRAAAKREATA